MEGKCIKESTMQQLQALLQYMEEHPALAKGTLVFGSNKINMDEQRASLSQNLNALGPPTRSKAEWKKTWADLKSRTKKKIAENQKSLRETGGGLYRSTSLTAIEQRIDRIFLLSSAAAPSGEVFGDGVDAIEKYFQSSVETPTKRPKSVAVVTPSGLSGGNNNTQPADKPQSVEKCSNLKRRIWCESDDDGKPACSSSKKKKSVVDAQLFLIRRQLRVAEKSAAAATEQADAMNRVPNAAEMQAESAKRRAAAAEEQITYIRALEKTTQSIAKNIELFLNLKK